MQTSPEILAGIAKLDMEDQAALSEWLIKRAAARKVSTDCFVIMPFSMTTEGRSSSYWDNFFEYFLKPALNACGYTARRSQARPDNIVSRILEDLALTDVVVAVLTDFNANVWYELGVRHSLQRGKTILLCQSDQLSRLPFDLSQHGVLAYNSDLKSSPFTEELRQQIASLTWDLQDSPVSKFLNSENYYCVNRALSGLRCAQRVLDAFDLTCPRDKAGALDAIRNMDHHWREREVQFAVVENDKVIVHKGDAPSHNANECWMDAVSDKKSLYPQMKKDGKGLRLASMVDCHGRITAIAFSTHPLTQWVLVVEAHVKQGALG